MTSLYQMIQVIRVIKVRKRQLLDFILKSVDLVLKWLLELKSLLCWDVAGTVEGENGELRLPDSVSFVVTELKVVHRLFILGLRWALEPEIIIFLLFHSQIINVNILKINLLLVTYLLLLLLLILLLLLLLFHFFLDGLFFI